MITEEPNECIHELPIGQCSWCNGKPVDREIEELLNQSGSRVSDTANTSYEIRVAMYDGKCARCGEQFEVGDTIKWSRDTHTTIGPCCALEAK